MRIFLPDPAARRPRFGLNRQSAIALVITLIMISVIAFMAITFLIISQRERGSVSVAAAQTDARLAAETALQTATAKLLAPVVANTNPFAYDLLASKNYINTNGFDLGNGGNLTNVNYDYTTGGNALSVNEHIQNIANLQYDPRPPVFIVTNKTSGGTDFRYYLDLNRNARPEPNGLQPVLDVSGNTNGLWANFIGDPEWIGLLQRPDQPHSATNLFIARYAFFAVPASKTLDLNYVHNQANRPNKGNLDAFGGDFLRNQGVGSWELNLAAALTDLNTNTYAWGGNNYVYDPLGSGAASGFAFIDAGGLYAWRLNRSLANLQSVNALFGAAGNLALGGNRIDDYSAGVLLTGGAYGADPDAARTTLPWSGADSVNRFFDTQDLFDVTKTASAATFTASTTNFTATLQRVGANNSSYDRHTFYRLFAQLGTDSAAETGKLNLNYRNVTNGVVVPGMETNFYAWDIPLEFFTNVADRLLQNLATVPEYDDQFGNRALRVTNIMVWPTNEYTPAVHRMLQVAANLYDATTNRNLLSDNLYAPSVFRPLFRRETTGRIFIAGYREVVNADLAYPTTAPPYVDLAETNTYSVIPLVGAPFDPVEKNEPLVYGVPLVVGAKKGFPGFSSLGLETAVRVTRKLRLSRPSITARPDEIRQMYLFGITNRLAVAAWNSYGTNYPRSADIFGAVDVTTILTNENGIIPTLFGAGLASNRYSVPISMSIPAGTWSRFFLSNAAPSFRIPISNSFEALPDCSVWQSANPASSLGFFQPMTNNFAQVGLTPPHWWMNMNTRMRFIIVDPVTKRILDYVNLSSDAETINLTEALVDGSACDGNPSADTSDGGVWCTNKPATYPPYAYVPTYGILNQMGISRGQPAVSDARWRSFNAEVNNKAKSIANFSAFMNANPSNTNLVMQAPFSPCRTIYRNVSWAVNDPLVHYTVQDLTDLLSKTLVTTDWDENPTSPLKEFGTKPPSRYRPWGGYPYWVSPKATDYPFQLELKDPLVKNSDQWDFPTGQFPNIGWLGRVHRGTPWQTLYLKSTGVDGDTWRKWTGNTDIFDSVLSQPEQDRRMLDLFTTAPNANATHVLPVNQTGLAAWSAVLSGLIVADTNGNAKVVDPAGISPEVETIVNGIYSYRTGTNFPGLKTAGLGYFTNLGAVLAVPELTTNSPFLGGANISSAENANMTDAVVERIPQQMLSLLRLGDQPRFVIYAYGQALKPADRSVVPGGTFAGMSTNYQITAETAVRAVVRVEGVSATATRPYRPQIVIESYNVLPPD